MRWEGHSILDTWHRLLTWKPAGRCPRLSLQSQQPLLWAPGRGGGLCPPWGPGGGGRLCSWDAGVSFPSREWQNWGSDREAAEARSRWHLKRRQGCRPVSRAEEQPQPCCLFPSTPLACPVARGPSLHTRPSSRSRAAATASTWEACFCWGELPAPWPGPSTALCLSALADPRSKAPVCRRA